MKNEVSSVRLTTKGKTYFFDVKKAQNDKLYLVITESGMPDKEGKRKRSSVIIFSEDFKKFKSTINEISLE